MVSIIRCAPAATRSLVKELREAMGEGTTWTPLITYRRRLPRSRKTAIVTRPAMPGYIFATLTPPSGLMRRRGMAFLLNPQTGRPAECSLAELQELRQAVMGVTEKIATKTEAVSIPLFPLGVQVRIGDAHHWFKGMTGEVLCQKGEDVTIYSPFLGGRLKISAFILCPLGL